MQSVPAFLVLLAFTTTSAFAQEQPKPREMQKDPRAATVFGIILPGGGHIYAGETTRGVRTSATATQWPSAWP